VYFHRLFPSSCLGPRTLSTLKELYSFFFFPPLLLNVGKSSQNTALPFPLFGDRAPFLLFPAGFFSLSGRKPGCLHLPSSSRSRSFFPRLLKLLDVRSFSLQRNKVLLIPARVFSFFVGRLFFLDRMARFWNMTLLFFPFLVAHLLFLPKSRALPCFLRQNPLFSTR